MKLRNNYVSSLSTPIGEGRFPAGFSRFAVIGAATVAFATISGTVFGQVEEVPPTGASSEPETGGSAISLSGEVSAGEGTPQNAATNSEDGLPAPSAEIAATTPEVPAYAGVRATRKSDSLNKRFASKPYLQRYKPEGNLWEMGMFTGVLFPSGNHNLKVPVLPREEYSGAAMQLGGRVAYFPLPFVGAELEGFVAGGALKDSGYSALFYSLRAHVIAQLPLWSVTPFVLLGGGTLGAISETMGHDRDPAFHFGAGVKVPINHFVSGRFDVRDIMSQKGNGAKNGKQTHHPELHLGVTFTFERTTPGLPSDRDFDGLYDGEDTCPDEGALTIDGCLIRDESDSDGDGVQDSLDQCPAQPGEPPTGCPNLDKDGDGVLLPADQCPEQAGVPPNGCVDEDPDKDGFVGAADKCPEKAENRNGFQDTDGCPDEMPEAIKRFTGVIQGVNFRQGTAEIEVSSHPTLDAAVEILQTYPTVSLEVSGHTSSEGGDERNQELSNERASAVVSYFVAKGIEAKRVVARGAGSSEPIADNGTKAGRKQNRRIEFRILSQP